jgi:beta-lactamase class A
MIDRRQFIVAVPAGLIAGAAHAHPVLGAPVFDTSRITAAVKAAESATGGRVGFAVHDGGNGLGSGFRFSHRGAERFPMASTFKMLLAAAILERIDKGSERLDRPVAVAASDILEHSPVTEQHVGGTATVAQLCEAAIIYSDNAAANLLLPAIGGPAGLTKFLRRIGDSVTRLDRTEPELNEALPGDPRDTTSPDAMLETWDTLLFGTTLSFASRVQLRHWLMANTTGGTRLRAGLPKAWPVGDKTGTGRHNSVNDIATAWPSRGSSLPVTIVCLMHQGTASVEVHAMAHADLARAVATSIMDPKYTTTSPFFL